MTTARPLRPDALALRRILLLQMGLIVVATVLILISAWLESGQHPGLGFFWFAFIAGCLGSSVALLRRGHADRSALCELGRSWVALLVPHLYGGLMAGLAYMLFVSGILTGTGEDGLLTSNLFPDFGSDDPTIKPSITAYLAMRPVTIADAGRLMVWCFIAGYSEKFVTGVLDQLELKQTPQAPADRNAATMDEPGSNPENSDQ